jgi:uncharacterized protein YjcR
MAMHQADEPRADDQAPARDRQVARARRREARSLWHRGWQLTQIAAELGVKYGTLAAWKSRDGWDEDAPIAVVEDRLEARIALLLDKEPFTEGDMKRVDFMMRQMERAARIRKFDKTGREGDLNPKIARRNDEEAKAKRADKRKNFLSPEQWQALLDDFHARNFAYQEHWWAYRDERTRKILKSRQIGATWYFAREALAKIAQGVLAGAQPRNQIFLSASQRQANKFRREIVGWVKRVTGVELKGNPIMLDLTGLTEDGPALDSVGLYPLSTNSNTAQGESGDFYFDEFFWVHGFAQLRKVAAAMATHTIYKRTYFSTPSTKTHEAYAFWSGEEWNKGRRREQQQPFDTSKRNLRAGATMPDGSWQQIVTLDDAIAGGAGGLIDREELRQESSDEEFSNLYDCEFIDDSESSFPFARIAPARVDSFYRWRDFRPALIEIPARGPLPTSRSGWATIPTSRAATMPRWPWSPRPRSRAASSACSKSCASTGATLPGRPTRSARLPAAITSPTSPSTRPAMASPYGSWSPSGSRSRARSNTRSPARPRW